MLYEVITDSADGALSELSLSVPWPWRQYGNPPAVPCQLSRDGSYNFV